MYSALNKVSEYMYFCILKNITSYTFATDFLKSSKAFSLSLGRSEVLQSRGVRKKLCLNLC